MGEVTLVYVAPFNKGIYQRLQTQLPTPVAARGGGGKKKLPSWKGILDDIEKYSTESPKIHVFLKIMFTYAKNGDYYLRFPNISQGHVPTSHIPSL